jgi:hypothetical protein
MNVTTSVCDDDAVETCRIVYRPFASNSSTAKSRPPAAVFLNSDGVDDTFPVNENEKHLFGFFRTLTLNFIDELKKDPKGGFDEGVRQVREFLPDLSKRGSGDDVSLACLIDFSAVKALEAVLRKQIEAEEKQKAAAAAAKALAAATEKARAAKMTADRAAAELAGAVEAVKAAEETEPAPPKGKEELR